MSNSTQLMTMNGLGILPFKRDNQWTVCCKDATGQVKTGNNIAKTFGNVSDVYSKIKRYAEDGEKEVYFNHRGVEEEDQISEVQVAILREAGYTVEWNRPCLWYEISGWSE